MDSDVLSYVLGQMQTDDFYDPFHRQVFDAMRSVDRDGGEVDVLTMETWLKDNANIEDVSGRVMDLTYRASSVGNIEYHCQLLMERAAARGTILSCVDTQGEAYENRDVFDLIDRHEQRMHKIVERFSTKESQPVKETIGSVMDQVRHRREHGFEGVRTGFYDLDHYMAGFNASDLIIIAARPAMGKTALVLSMAQNMALGDGVPVTNPGIFSLEMDRDQLQQRSLSKLSKVPLQNIRLGELSDEEYRRLLIAQEKIEKMGIVIDDTPGLSVMELRSKARRMIKRHNVGVIMVDYLQLMQDRSINNTQNREVEVSNISRALKRLAKELHVPVVVLSQLNRSVETRGGSKRPLLSDLRESGSIEQDADAVLFLYRSEYYGILTDEIGTSTEGIAEIIIAKQRNGPCATVQTHFNAENAGFHNLAKQEF